MNAYSYATLCKKAGLPQPTGFAEFDTLPKRQRGPRLADSAKKEWLRVSLDAMVARGELAKTPDGRYCLPPSETTQ